MDKMYINGVDSTVSPCKECLNRYVGCHSTCVKYIDWKQSHEVKLQEMHNKKKINSILFNNQSRRNKKLSQEGGIKYGRGNNSR